MLPGSRSPPSWRPAAVMTVMTVRPDCSLRTGPNTSTPRKMISSGLQIGLLPQPESTSPIPRPTTPTTSILQRSSRCSAVVRSLSPTSSPPPDGWQDGSSTSDGATNCRWSRSPMPPTLRTVSRTPPGIRPVNTRCHGRPVLRGSPTTST